MPGKCLVLFPEDNKVGVEVIHLLEAVSVLHLEKS